MTSAGEEISFSSTAVRDSTTIGAAGIYTYLRMCDLSVLVEDYLSLARAGKLEL